MKALAIGGMNVRRMLRDRSNIFFVFIFPMLLILVIGATFGGSFEPKLGVVTAEGELAEALIGQLEATPDIGVERYETVTEMTDDVQTGRLNAGVVIPADYDARLGAGSSVSVEYISGPDQLAQQLQRPVQAAITRQSTAVIAAELIEAEALATFDEGLALSLRVSEAIEGVDVAVETTGESQFGNIGQFDLGAPQNLVLFVFLTSLAASASLIQSRRWGVSRRMLSTPTSNRQILLGESLGRFGVAMVQGVFIMLGSLFAFGVNWGSPVAASALLIAFAAVGAGGGMLLGSVLDNDEQGASLGVFLGLGFAAIGGAMVPIEIFPETMKTVAHFTPHAWAIDGFSDLIRHDGGLADVLPEIGVLALYAVGLLAAAAYLLRRKLTA